MGCAIVRAVAVLALDVGELRDVGEVVNVTGNELLAVVPVESADSGTLNVNGIALREVALPYDAG